MNFIIFFPILDLGLQPHLSTRKERLLPLQTVFVRSSMESSGGGSVGRMDAARRVRDRDIVPDIFLCMAKGLEVHPLPSVLGKLILVLACQ